MSNLLDISGSYDLSGGYCVAEGGEEGGRRRRKTENQKVVEKEGRSGGLPDRPSSLTCPFSSAPVSAAYMTEKAEVA